MKKFPFPSVTVGRLILEKGYEDVITVRDNYVGRGQLPSHRSGCIGFVAPEVRIVVQFLLELAGETEAEGVALEDLVDMAGTMCVDGMGHDCIVYFSGYTEFADPPTEEELGAEALEDAYEPVANPGRTIINNVSGPVNGTVFQIANVAGEVRINR